MEGIIRRTGTTREIDSDVSARYPREDHQLMRWNVATTMLGAVILIAPAPANEHCEDGRLSGFRNDLRVYQEYPSGWTGRYVVMSDEGSGVSMTIESLIVPDTGIGVGPSGWVGHVVRNRSGNIVARIA
jgi:hypothetical protein